MASSWPNRSSVRFMSFLCVCDCLLSALSQRQSVCGFGPHLLNLTGLDTFVLQGSYVMLQPIRNTQSSRIMTWSTSDNRRTLLQSGSTKQPNNSLKIGPMKKDFNRLYVRYVYQLGSGGVAQYVSNTAVLYMAAKDFNIVPKANSVFNQLVQVGTGAERRVICYRLIPRAQDNNSYVPPTQRSLTKQLRGTAITGYNTVPDERYFFREGCLWMRSLQQTDSGKYSLRIRDCFSSQFKATVNFSLSVNQAPVSPRSTYLSMQHSLPLSHRSTEATIPSRIIKQPTFTTLTATAPSTAETEAVFPSNTGTRTVGNTGKRETTNYAIQEIYTWTIPVIISPNDSRNSTIYSEGWIVGIVILFVSLVLLIPVVYFSYKRRHTLSRICVRRHQDVTTGQQPQWAKYVKSAENSVVDPAARISSTEMEVTDSGQTDSVIVYESVEENRVHQIIIAVKFDIPVRDNPAYGTVSESVLC